MQVGYSSEWLNGWVTILDKVDYFILSGSSSFTGWFIILHAVASIILNVLLSYAILPTTISPTKG